MTKSEWIWTAIRIFGIYLIVKAVVATPEALGAFYTFLTLPESGEGPALEVSAKLQRAVLHKGVVAICQAIIFFAVGLYMVSRGKLIHDLAVRESA